MHSRTKEFSPMSRKGKVTVVGAGFYGSTTAQLLAEYDIFEEVVLTDIVEGKPEGLALDMNQSRPVEGFETKVTGQTTGQAGEGYEVIGGSDIVIVTAGLARKPGMSRMDLIETNAKIVRSVVENVAKYAPDAVLIVVSNPLDEMTALAAKVSGFPSARVMGQAGMLDTARFSYFVAEKLAVPVGAVRTLTLGSHGDTMVPVPSACTVSGQPLAGLLPADGIGQGVGVGDVDLLDVRAEVTLVIGDEAPGAHAHRRGQVGRVRGPQPVSGGQRGGELGGGPIHRAQVQPGQQPGQDADLVGAAVAQCLIA